MSERLRVTKLAHHGSYWSANVSLNGTTIRVDNSTGAWAAPEGKGSALEARSGWHVLPPAARVLQQKVRRLERQNGRDPSVNPGRGKEQLSAKHQRG